MAELAPDETTSNTSAHIDETSSVARDYAEIVVVRHGETAWNAEGRIQGHLDVDLNEAGRKQAVSVAARLSKEPKISCVYTSDLKRALETADMIAADCGGLEVLKDPDLRERSLGEMEGLVYREAPNICPEAYKAFISPRLDLSIPGGGESRNQLRHRCTAALQKIGDKHRGERVAVVTHGGVIRSLYKRACPNGGNAGRILNTSVSVLHLYEGGKWTIELWNDVSHLHESSYLESGFGGDRTSG